MRLTVLMIFTSYCFFSFIEAKKFVKEYFPTGQQKSEGWVIMNSTKIGYWKFFNPNGTLSSEGNFDNNLKNGYWFFYNSNGSIIKEGHYNKNIPSKWWIYHTPKTKQREECLFTSNGKTRYCLVYQNDKLTKASKYHNDVFLQHWTSISSFRQDNPEFKF